jgi:serine/threonine protein kinase
LTTVLAEGTLLDGKYEIRGQLAAGGMGEVYLAHRTLLGDDVAVKVIREIGPDPGVWRERFLRESRASAQLRHPHIVTILDFNVDAAGQPYLVMEYLNGPSLQEELKVRERFDLATVQHVLATVGSALHLAHTSGIIHRDLKPQNIVSHRFPTGEVVHKVIDFGLVTLRSAAESTRLTQAHEFLGTVAYAAPEQFTGASPDAKADQYSLGVIVYELLAGCRPIEGDGFMVIVDRHLNQAPVPLGERRPDLPHTVTSAVMRALAKRPDDRWPTVMDFARAFTGAEATVSQIVPQPASALLSTFELGPVIAEGRFGSRIHAGTHRALGHPVAIRTFRHAGRPDREAVRARFLREARTLQVSHPNLIHVRDFGQDAEMLYVVTDLLKGSSLEQRLEAGPLSLDELTAWLAQVLDATAALHRHGGRITGLHPGIVRLVEEGGTTSVAISSAGVHQIQDVLSTLSEDALRAQATDETELLHVAPELLMGKAATERSDVYTAGVLGYQMATGRTPYDASTLPVLLGAMFEGPPPDPRTLRGDLPPARAAVLMRALARDPDDRFETADGMLRAWTT